MSITEINGRIIPSAFEAKMYSLEEVWKYANFPILGPHYFETESIQNGIKYVGIHPLRPAWDWSPYLKKEFRFGELVNAFLFGRLIIGLNDVHMRKPVERLDSILQGELEHNWERTNSNEYKMIDTLLKPYQSILSEIDFAWLEKQLRFVEARIDFEGGQPVRFYPLTRDIIADSPKMIVLDPEIRYGRPTLSGHGLTTKVLLERFLGGDSISEISEDFEIRPEEMEEVIRYEARHPEQLTFDFRHHSE